MNIQKPMVWCSYGLFFFLWTVLSPVAFHGEFNQYIEEISPDGNYRVVAYQVLPTTPYGVVQRILFGDLYLVLYDREGHYLGQSSPFHFSDEVGIFGASPTFPFEVGNTSELDRSFYITTASDYQDGYQIPVDHMHWWSHLLSAFY